MYVKTCLKTHKKRCNYIAELPERGGKNYRGISLLSTSYKVLSSIILNRIKSYTREIIGECQSGFIPGR